MLAMLLLAQKVPLAYRMSSSGFWRMRSMVVVVDEEVRRTRGRDDEESRGRAVEAREGGLDGG
jgi:hypothetical protein